MDYFAPSGKCLPHFREPAQNPNPVWQNSWFYCLKSSKWILDVARHWVGPGNATRITWSGSLAPDAWLCLQVPQNRSSVLLSSSDWEPAPLTWIPPELLTFCSLSGLLHTKLGFEGLLSTVTTSTKKKLLFCVPPGEYSLLESAWGAQNILYNPWAFACSKCSSKHKQGLFPSSVAPQNSPNSDSASPVPTLLPQSS